MYCLPSDVSLTIDQEKAKHLLGIDHDGDMTDDELSPYIEAASNEINSALGPWYVIPITGTQSLMILKDICVGLALSFIYLSNEDEALPIKIRQKIIRANETLDLYGKGVKFEVKDNVMVRPLQYLPDAPSNQKAGVIASNAALDYSRGI